MERRNFCKGLPGMALGLGGLAASRKPLLAQVTGPDSTQVAEIYQLQAAFHLAKSTQNIDLLMSLWDPNGSLTIPGDPNSPYVGFDRLRAYLLSTGSFTISGFHWSLLSKSRSMSTAMKLSFMKSAMMLATSICRLALSRRTHS